MAVVRLGEESQNCLRHSEEITQIDKGRQTSITHDTKDHTRHTIKDFGDINKQ